MRNKYLQNKKNVIKWNHTETSHKEVRNKTELSTYYPPNVDNYEGRQNMKKRDIDVLSAALIMFCVIMWAIYPELTERLVPFTVWLMMLAAGTIGEIKTLLR